ncbi:MAG: AIR synthase family protein [Candidatus Bathyarchaeota archaeon]|nr:AIR synthase family protein [Candidatus Bathyarchaeota archaeon]MDH5732607.1 AIR synthase family protein [Candidatus Bathyarchaeota archaeon]
MTQQPLSVGKLEPNILEQLVFGCLGAVNSRVIVGPKIGEDAAIIDFKDRVLVVHSDPITGTLENIGWLAINVCTNDVATRGIRPQWVLIVMLLPQDFNSEQLNRITQQMNKAAKKLDVAIIGGHTEVTSSVNRPVVVATAIGEAEKEGFVRTSGAEIGDCIIVTKGAAIEGTAILSTEMDKFLHLKVDKRLIRSARNFIQMTSVLDDALTAMEIGEVHAMHDATEGGVAGALQEVAWASNIGIMAYEEKIPIHKETEAICDALNIDALKTISSGTLLIFCHPNKAEKIVNALRRKGIKASIVGEALKKEEGCHILRHDGSTLDLSIPVKEELWTILESHNIPT